MRNLLLTLILTCSSHVLASYSDYATTEEILSQFHQEAKLHGTSLGEDSAIRILPNFNELSPHLKYVLGFCIPATNQIFLNGAFWNYDRNESRELVLFHELGHCMLGRDHIEGQVDGHSSSIMSARRSNVTLQTYTKYRKYYIDELFSKVHK